MLVQCRRTSKSNIHSAPVKKITIISMVITAAVDTEKLVVVVDVVVVVVLVVIVLLVAYFLFL